MDHVGTMRPDAPAPAKDAAAGWYPDPTLPGQQRYWDGEAWTPRTQVTVPVEPIAPLPAEG
ncbi:DUF2510 domain-containing protein [Demequina lignilytica]|uniref:DUF2510 domain-containing protein n=1 Tax=Demequina lignilytica TaxID=3051663 RepID=A0AB35MIW2_9MICO|nr:DUF2510 domain-containing protein [Demequina sp. SYSU T0a273]MDN4483764.1 DUF2510 domain-containing protein [Demequina sp. SYSU T0a273]